MKKRLLSILSIIACLCLVCTLSVATVSAADMESSYPIDYFTGYTEEWLGLWVAGDYSALDANNQQYTGYGMQVTYDVTEEEYNEMIAELGTFKEYNEASISYNEETAIINQKALFENRNVDFVFSFNTETGEITWVSDMESTMSETVAKAGMNTLMGMGTVFCVLIFISFIISLFKIFSKFGNKKTEAPAAVPETPAAPAEPSSNSYSDDEIAAVIAAAIAAYEEDEEMFDVPADGLVVRSIKKRGFC